MKNDTDASTKDQILESAMHLLRGNTKVPFTLTQLAEHLEMHHTAIYHYFESKDHIVCELIERISARRAANLQRARQEQSSGLEQLLEFIRAEVNEPPTDLLVRPTLLLKQPHRDNAEASISSVSTQIEDQIERGISDGSIRPCDKSTVVSLLLKLINRYSHRQDAMLISSGLTSDQIAENVVSIIRDGVALRPSTAESLLAVDPVPFPTLTDKERQLDVIQRALTTAFNEQGFAATSIPRVAASIGVSKTSVYKYAETKADLLYLCLRNTLDLVLQARQVASAVSSSPLEALLYNLYYVRQLEAGPPGPLLQPFLYQHQSPASLLVGWDIFERQRDNILALFTKGIAEGEIRALEPVAAVPAHSVFANYAAGDVGFADEIAQIFLTGIASGS